MINYYIKVTTHGTGSTRIVSGLPYAATTATGGGHLAYYANLDQNFNSLSAYIYNGSTMTFYGNSTETSSLSSAVSVFKNNAVVQGSHTYFAST